MCERCVLYLNYICVVSSTHKDYELTLHLFGRSTSLQINKAIIYIQIGRIYLIISKYNSLILPCQSSRVIIN